MTPTDYLRCIDLRVRERAALGNGGEVVCIGVVGPTSAVWWSAEFGLCLDSGVRRERHPRPDVTALLHFSHATSLPDSLGSHRLALRGTAVIGDRQLLRRFRQHYFPSETHAP